MYNNNNNRTLPTIDKVSVRFDFNFKSLIAIMFTHRCRRAHTERKKQKPVPYHSKIPQTISKCIYTSEVFNTYSCPHKQIHSNMQSPEWISLRLFSYDGLLKKFPP